LSPISLFFIFTLALFNITSVRGGRVLLALYALDLGAQRNVAYGAFYEAISDGTS
jgi:hypothetical protein